MKKVQLLYFVFILLILGGCTNDVLETPDDSPINKDGSIAFRTDSILTRGIPRDDIGAYNTVNLIVYSHTGTYANDKSLYRETVLQKEANTTPTKWNYSPPMFWPEGDLLSFLAYSSDQAYASASGLEGVFIKGKASDGAPVIEYKVPSDVKKQPDLLVTALLNHKKVNNVTLPMKHALACVSFCATGPSNMRVKNIKLKNVYSEATLKLDTTAIKWKTDPNSKKKDVVVSEPGIDPNEPLDENPNKGNYLMTPDGFLMMIPQTLTDATIDVVYWKETTGTEQPPVTLTLPTTVVWEPGKKYIYKFGVGEEIVVYYEKYADDLYGFQTTNTKINHPLDEAKVIIEAGYGVLTNSKLVSSKPTIQLGEGEPISAKKIPAASGEYDLYAVSQTSIPGSKTFELSTTSLVPVEVFFDSNSEKCGKIIPHFAKGVSDWNPNDNTYYIRTPQQLLNTSAITTASTDLDAAKNPSYYKILKQERNLDFSVANIPIGGGNLTGPVVDQVFAGTYNSDPSWSINNLTINAAGSDNIGIFSITNGPINNVIVKAATITGKNNVGVIAGDNWWGGQISKARIIGINSTSGSINVSGVDDIGGLVGINRGKITGNDEIDPATDLTYAEVSGWVNINGTGDRVGGIAGHNAMSEISRVLVYGVYSNSSTPNDVTPAKIKISGRQQVGGITGVNELGATIHGNVTGTGNNIKNMPDVGGVMEIEGGDWVGGIAGTNGGKLNSVNIRLGRTPATTITATAGHGAGTTGQNVGGIVGENTGEMGAESNTFISLRGNIYLKGTNNVGGIVGRNGAGQLQNCFVYDFIVQRVAGGNVEYYAPKIECTGTNVGGIAGENMASITNSSVFSSSNTLISISANESAGGLIGSNKEGANVDNCSVIGKIEVNGTTRSGGICGDNKTKTKISTCWIGSSDGYDIIENAKRDLGLVTAPPSVTLAYGTPFITGSNYIGGIVGLNDGGVIDKIELKDNVVIGQENISNWVGGIVGGNGPSSGATVNVIQGCTVEQPQGKTIAIQGAWNLGGIAGLNNGVIDGCTVKGISALTIKGQSKVGGIVGQIGGHNLIELTDVQFGNDNTVVKNCNVFGNVNIEGDKVNYAVEVGGIAGLVGATRDNIYNVFNCKVGDASGKISIAVTNKAGGIAGKNTGNISGCEVRNVAVAVATVEGAFAGGLVGEIDISAAAFTPSKGYRGDINGCKVYSGVAITGHYSLGALVGKINSSGPADLVVGNKVANQISSTGITVNGSVGNALGEATNGATLKYTPF